jgi:chromosome segregation ATPase
MKLQQSKGRRDIRFGPPTVEQPQPSSAAAMDRTTAASGALSGHDAEASGGLLAATLAECGLTLQGLLLQSPGDIQQQLQQVKPEAVNRMLTVVPQQDRDLKATRRQLASAQITQLQLKRQIASLKRAVGEGNQQVSFQELLLQETSNQLAELQQRSQQLQGAVASSASQVGMLQSLIDSGAVVLPDSAQHAHAAAEVASSAALASAADVPSGGPGAMGPDSGDRCGHRVYDVVA